LTVDAEPIPDFSNRLAARFPHCPGEPAELLAREAKRDQD
jgi:hypothetical protein